MRRRPVVRGASGGAARGGGGGGGGGAGGASGGALSQNQLVRLALVLAVVLFLPSLRFDFTLDDSVAVVANNDVQGQTPVSDLFLNDYWGRYARDPSSMKSYRPLTTLSFRINRAVLGAHPMGFHLVNAAIHVAVVYLFIQVCQLRGVPLEAAVLFACHPVHVESVSSIVGRADELGTLLALLAYLAWHRDRILVAMGLVVTAALCKETTTTFFVVLFVEEAWATRGRLRRDLAFPVIVCLAFVQWRTTVTGGLTPSIDLFSWRDNPLLIEGRTLWADPTVVILTGMATMSEYLRLLVFPVKLAYDYSMYVLPPVRSLTDLRVPVYLAVSAAVGVLVLWALFRQKRQSIVLGILILFGCMVPALNVLMQTGTTVAERLMYLPSVGFCILAAELARDWLAKPVGRRVFFLVVALFSMRTLSYSEAWLNNDTLNLSGIENQPMSTKTLYNAALTYSRTGQERVARDAMVRSYLMDGDLDSLMGAALSSERLGEFDEAAKWLELVGNYECTGEFWTNQREKCMRRLFKALHTVIPFFRRRGDMALHDKFNARGQELAARYAPEKFVPIEASNQFIEAERQNTAYRDDPLPEHKLAVPPLTGPRVHGDLTQ